MAYIVPRVQIQQDFSQIPIFSEQPLVAFIVGPQYALFRYNVVAEKQLTAVVNPDETSGNAYDANADVTYPFPNRPAGGHVDDSYTKLYIDGVEAQYFPLADLGSSTSDNDVTKVETGVGTGKYFANRVRFSDSGTILQTLNGFSRSAFFDGRDVKVGDIIELTDDQSNVLRSKIKGLYADGVAQDGSLAAQVGVALASGTNGATTSSQFTFTSTGASFTSALIGQYLTVNTQGTFKIIAVPSATTLKVDRAFAATASGLTFHIGGLYNDPSNLGPQSSDITPAATYSWNGIGSDPTVTNLSVTNSSSAYVGYPDLRVASDTYTVTVTTGGNESAVRFSVASAAGVFTTQSNVALTAVDTGAHTGTLVVDSNGGNAVTLDFALSSGKTFTIGQTWTVLEKSTVALVQPTIGGSYTGASSIVYKLSVIRGGPFYDGTNADTCARVAITSSNVDGSATVNASVTNGLNIFNVGTLGITAHFTAGSLNSSLILGDVYYITALPASKGKVKIVELTDALPDSMITLAASIKASLFLSQSNLIVPETRSLEDDTTNYDTNSEGITVKAGITTYVSTLTAANTPVRLPVAKGKVYVEHRDLLADNVVSISSLNSTGDVASKLGTVHPDNPLAQGVYDAVLNAAGVSVYYLGVASDDLAGYNGAIEIAKNSDTVYSFVPLTFDRSIQDAIIGHVNAYSAKEIGRWRVCWLSTQLKKTSLIYDLKSDNSVWQGTITDDPAATGTQNRLLTVAGATFVTDGIRPGDTVLFNFRLNPDGLTVSDSLTVDSVVAETKLVTTTSLASPITIPTLIKIQRNYTKDEQASNLSLVGGEFNNRRVRNVFPDTLKSGNIVKQGYFLAAALAGLRSGVVPHQGLTNAEVLGYDDLSQSVTYFSQDQLNVLAQQGIWIVTQAVIGATPYVRHQLTTDTSGLNTSEDSITTNVDSISYGLQRVLQPFIGKYNRNPESMVLIKDAINTELLFRKNNTYTVQAGNQLNGFEITKFEADTEFKDRLNVVIGIDPPAPYNNINVDLLV